MVFPVVNNGRTMPRERLTTPARAEVSVAAVWSRLVFDQVSCEENLLLWQQRNGVNLSVAATNLENLQIQISKVDGHFALQRHRRPHEARPNRFGVTEQARKPADFAGLVRSPRSTIRSYVSRLARIS
jgi:hypothetical protein